MIVRREIWNERESATEIDVDGAWCNEYETDCSEPVDDKVDEQCVIIYLLIYLLCYLFAHLSIGGMSCSCN